MDISSIFSLFEFDGDDHKSDKGYEKTLKEIEEMQDTPLYKVGMFKKIMTNGLLFKNQIMKFFSSSKPPISLGNIDEAGESILYQRAFEWVKECNIRKKDWKEAIKFYSSEEYVGYIKLVIQYYEDIEDYEKCALLKKIQDLMVKNLIEEV